MVELVISLMILTVGVLAMATALGYLVLQIRSADARTERSLAVEQVEEQLRGVDFDALDDVDQADAQEVGDFEVWWSVEPMGGNLKRITIYSEGPGFAPGTGWGFDVADSSSLSLARIGP